MVSKMSGNHSKTNPCRVALATDLLFDCFRYLSTHFSVLAQLSFCPFLGSPPLNQLGVAVSFGLFLKQFAGLRGNNVQILFPMSCL